MKPIIVVNFKAYREATGKNAVKLAKAIEEAAKRNERKVIVAVQAADIFPISKAVKIPVFAQHVDGNSYGSFTGSVTAESIKANSAKGTILNHAEKRIVIKEIAAAIKNCKKLGLKTLVCTDKLGGVKKLANLHLDYIAFEDPKLIGTGRSISKYRSKDVAKFAALLENKKIVPLCGAGVSNGEDVRAALKLGTKGVLVAKAIVKSKKPGSVLKEMLDV